MLRLIPLLVLYGAAVAAGPLEEDQGTGVTGAPEYRVVREGMYWVRIDSGALPATARLRVISPGKVSTQGEARTDIRYELKRRVRARNFESAKLLLGNRGLVHSVRGEWGTIAIAMPRSRGAITELELKLPRATRQSSFRVADGAVSAFDLDGSVNVNAGAGAVTMDRIQGAVSAETGGGEIRLGRITGGVRCISGGGGISIEGAGAESVVDTAGGEVFVREARGPVRANSGGGNIQILRAFARVEARTIGGIVEVWDARGMVQADTSGGAIQIGKADGVTCNAAAGAIELQNVSGSLQVSTLMGSIVAGITSRRLGDSFLNTSAGDITVLIPSNLPVTVQAESEAAGTLGRIFSDFPEIRILSFWPNGKPMQAQGALNGGGPLLKLSATGGIISLKRQQ